jgi:hypothetical protein
MDVAGEMFGLIAATGDYQDRLAKAIGHRRKQVWTGRIGDRYGRASAHERLHALVRQQF